LKQLLGRKYEICVANGFGFSVESYNQIWLVENLPSGIPSALTAETELPMGIVGKLLGLIAHRMSEAIATKIQPRFKTWAEA
jgi:hypothetical protein